MIKKNELILFTILILEGITFCQGFCQTMKEEFRIENFQLGVTIKSYPEFQFTDSVPANSLIECGPIPLPNANFYLHDSPEKFIFFKKSVKYIIATTTKKNDEVIAIHVVSNYAEDFLTELQNHFGHWKVASSGGFVSDSIPKVGGHSFYLWEYQQNDIELTINRNLYFLNSVVSDLQDFVTVSYKVRDYRYQIRALNKQ